MGQFLVQNGAVPEICNTHQFISFRRIPLDGFSKKEQKKWGSKTLFHGEVSYYWMNLTVKGNYYNSVFLLPEFLPPPFRSCLIAVWELKGFALSSSSSPSVNFNPQTKLSLLLFDQVILLGRHSLVIVKTVCWVFLSCQCYGSLCKLICSSQCLSVVKQCAWFFRFLLWPWFTLQIYIISLCGSCVSKIFWLRQKMGSYVDFVCNLEGGELG